MINNVDVKNNEYDRVYNIFNELANNFISYIKQNDLLDSKCIKAMLKKITRAKLMVTDGYYLVVKFNGTVLYQPLNKIKVVTKRIIAHDKISPEICFINIRGLSEDDIREALFSEIIKITSHEILSIKLDYSSCYVREGFYYAIIDSNNILEWNKYINLGLREVIAKRLYEKIYNKKYHIFVDTKDAYLTLRMTDIVKDITDQKLLDIYFNCKTKEFEEITKLNLEELDISLGNY